MHALVEIDGERVERIAGRPQELGASWRRGGQDKTHMIGQFGDLVIW